MTAAWPRGRAADGGIDEIPLPEDVGAGRLWLCGKHAIGPDPDALLERVGASTVVCLGQRFELEDRYPAYVEWLDAAGAERAVWHPIHDLSAPAVDAFVVLVHEIVARLRAGERVIVHCAAGIGRAGTVAVGVLMELGMPVDDALRHVATHRPMAGPESGAQSTLITALTAP